MPFFQALGLGVAILVLKLLTPMVFHEIESTAILTLKGAQTGVSVATDIAASAPHARVLEPLVLPRAPSVR